MAYSESLEVEQVVVISLLFARIVEVWTDTHKHTLL